MKYLTMLSTLFGIIGILANTIIFWQKNRKNLLFTKLFADVVWTMHYVLLGAKTGAATCGISIMREIVFLNKKHTWAKSNLWLILFAVLSIFFGIFTWKNITSVLPVCASIISVISFAIGKPNLTRILQIFISVLFLIYDIYVVSYAGIINEIFTLTSVIFALYYFKRNSLT